MIRLGTMTSVCPDWSIEQIIDGMQRHGFEGLEPRAGWGHASGFELDMPAADRDAARAKMEDAGLKYPAWLREQNLPQKTPQIWTNPSPRPTLP